GDAEPAGARRPGPASRLGPAGHDQAHPLLEPDHLDDHYLAGHPFLAGDHRRQLQAVDLKHQRRLRARQEPPHDPERRVLARVAQVPAPRGLHLLLLRHHAHLPVLSFPGCRRAIVPSGGELMPTTGEKTITMPGAVDYFRARLAYDATPNDLKPRLEKG